jgi:hypothetical protein
MSGCFKFSVIFYKGKYGKYIHVLERPWSLHVMFS